MIGKQRSRGHSPFVQNRGTSLFPPTSHVKHRPLTGANVGCARTSQPDETGPTTGTASGGLDMVGVFDAADNRLSRYLHTNTNRHIEYRGSRPREMN